jgi:ankyrin repeat protein
MGETQSSFAEDYKNEYRNENLSNTKLMSALQKGQTERVAKLLKDISGKKLHKRDERGDTALHKAAAMGNGEILQQLISKGTLLVHMDGPYLYYSSLYLMSSSFL